MNEKIRVHVVKYDSSVKLLMRYRDPLTGKQVARTTGTTSKREAAKIAAKWESALQEGRYRKRLSISWEEVRQQYDDHVLTGLKPSTAKTYDSTFNVFAELAAPAKASSVTTSRITAFATALRTQRNARPATIARHLRTLRVLMRWAHREGLITELPNFDMPSGKVSMRGRAIDQEEFHILLSAVPSIVGEPSAESWRFLLRGFWTSGLRLREACNLHWGGRVGHVVDFTRKRPMFRICGDL